MWMMLVIAAVVSIAFGLIAVGREGTSYGR